MKKLLTLLFSLFCIGLFAQEEFYVGLHYFTVKKEFQQEFIQQERKYYSKMHKASIDAGEKLGWDMWRVQDPFSNSDKYVTFCFAHLQEIDKPLTPTDNNMFSKSEMSKVWESRSKMIVKTQFIQTVFKGGFVPAEGIPPPKHLTLNFYDVDWTSSYDYEKTALSTVESKQKSKYLKGWGLHKIVSKINDEADYIAASFYDSPEDSYKRYINTREPSAAQKERGKKMQKMLSLVRRENMQLVLFER